MVIWFTALPWKQSNKLLGDQNLYTYSQPFQNYILNNLRWLTVSLKLDFTSQFSVSTLCHLRGTLHGLISHLYCVSMGTVTRGHSGILNSLGSNIIDYSENSEIISPTQSYRCKLHQCVEELSDQFDGFSVDAAVQQLEEAGNLSYKVHRFNIVWLLT